MLAGILETAPPAVILFSVGMLGWMLLMLIQNEIAIRQIDASIKEWARQFDSDENAHCSSEQVPVGAGGAHTVPLHPISRFNSAGSPKSQGPSSGAGGAHTVPLHPISRVNSAGSRKTQGSSDAFSRVNSSSSGCASPQMRPLPKKPSSRASSTAVPPQTPLSRPSSTAVQPLVPLNVNMPHHLEQALVDTVVGNEAAAAAASPSALSAMMMNGFHANTSSLLVGLPHIASAGTYNTATCLGTADVLLLPDGQTVVFAPPPGLLPRSASLSPPRPDGSRLEHLLSITRGRNASSRSMVPEDTNQPLYTGGTMARAASFSPPEVSEGDTPAHQLSNTPARAAIQTYKQHLWY